MLLVAGGSGVVPLAAMLRRRVETGDTTPMRLLYSSRAPEDVIYAAELEQLDGMDGVEVIHTFTRAQPDGWTGYARRIDEAMLAAVAWPAVAAARRIRVRADPARRGAWPTGCSPSATARPRVRTERFGPTGGVGMSMDDDLRLDGNAAAGLLGEIFAVDLTAARCRCGGLRRDRAARGRGRVRHAAREP